MFFPLILIVWNFNRKFVLFVVPVFVYFTLDFYLTMKPYLFLIFCLFISTSINGCAGGKISETETLYKLDHVVYVTNDDQLRAVLEDKKYETSFIYGQPLDLEIFEKERKRIEKVVQKNVDPEFKKDLITFNVDTTQADHKYSVEVVVRRSK